MNEIIRKITDRNEGGYAGYSVETDKQVIVLEINDGSCCCETWGWFWCNDNVDDFVGADLLDVTVTDTILDTNKLVDLDEGDIMFVNLVTDRGVLQFVAYNAHNGYYGHQARVTSTQLSHEEYL